MKFINSFLYHITIFSIGLLSLLTISCSMIKRTNSKTGANRMAKLNTQISPTFDLQTAKNFRDLAGLGYADVTSVNIRAGLIESALTAEVSATNSDVLAINASVDSLEAVTSTEKLRAETAEGVISDALVAEISATNSDVVRIDAALAAEISATNGDVTAINASIDSIEIITGSLSSEIVTEKDRIDAILNGSTVDLDKFAEVVAYVQSLDTFDDNFLVNEITSMNLRDTHLEGSVDSLEAALAGEISSTNSDVVRIDGALTAETNARTAGDTYLEEVVTGVTSGAGITIIATVGNFQLGTFDTEVYINGVRVAFTHGAPNDWELNLVYALEATDKITFVGVQG